METFGRGGQDQAVWKPGLPDTKPTPEIQKTAKQRFTEFLMRGGRVPTEALIY